MSLEIDCIQTMKGKYLNSRNKCHECLHFHDSGDITLINEFNLT